eukprot:SAG22_NODE_639_length_8255_cov_13.659882_8_plen_104_part_00
MIVFVGSLGATLHIAALHVPRCRARLDSAGAGAGVQKEPHATRPCPLQVLPGSVDTHVVKSGPPAVCEELAAKHKKKAKITKTQLSQNDDTVSWPKQIDKTKS